MRTIVIVNPASGGGTTHRRWPKIRDLLYNIFDFETAFSQYAGHAVELGRDARLQGYSRVVCVGGDGTLNEVVNGAFPADTDNPMPELAIIPAGTGADFARTIGIPHGPEAACARLASPRTLVSDLGVVSFVDGQQTRTRYFANAAGLGYDAEVVSRRNGFNRYVRGTIPYLASLAATLLTYENKEITVTTGEIRTTRRANALVVAIGRYFGGGMRIAPNAELADGLFDLVTVGDVGKIRADI